MRKHLLTFLFILFAILPCNTLFAKPVFTQSKYLIAVLSSGSIGTVSPGTTDYPLVYYPDRDEESALETDYWIIEEHGNNQYSFRNAATMQYISYDTSVADRTALILVNEPATDQSTLFTLELKKTYNMPYYLIHPVINPAKVWDKRETQYNSLYPVGVFGEQGSNNELFIFYDSEGDTVSDDAMGKPDILQINRTLGVFQDYAYSLGFNSKTPVVDTSKKEFYLTVPESQMENNITMKVNFELKNETYTLYIDNKQVTNGGNFNFGYVSATTNLPIAIRNNSSVVASGTLHFSCLPLVQIYSEAPIGSVYNQAGLIVTESSKPDAAEIMHMNIKIRGGISAGMPKKPFAIKLKEADGQTSMDRSFFGLRNDNNWIMDAMYVDPARMRNRVSTDLWNGFSVKPYHYSSEPDLVNGTRGNFVEVFINDAYQGLYCMTEKVDRKQLKLKKLKDDVSPAVVRGGLYKGKEWNSGTIGGNLYMDGVAHSMSVNYSNKSGSWSGFDVKYPKLDDGDPIDWKPLVDAITVSSYLTSDGDFRTRVATCFDLPVFLDYYLFIDLMLASDNQGKNTYFSVYDQTKSSKVTITPWDCDGTWGRRWDGSSNLTRANQNLDTYLSNYEHAQNNLFLRLKSLDYDNYASKLKNRYRELRGNYFSYENLMNRFEKYYELFEKSGAAMREQNKWGISDLKNEMNFLSTWIADRLKYLDNQYLGGPYTSLANSINEGIVLSPNPVQDFLTLSNLTGSNDIRIISIQGKEIIHLQSNDSEIKVDMSRYAPGVYLIKIGNRVSKIVKN